jgi:ketol-acid reductoisomerase
VRDEMKKILGEIQSGRFADEWVEENRAGLPNYHRLQQEGAEHRVEKVGAQLRAMMPFLASGSPRPQDVSGG